MGTVSSEQTAGVGKGGRGEGRARGGTVSRGQSTHGSESRDQGFFWVGGKSLKFKQKGTLFDPYLEEFTLWHGEQCGGARVGADRLRRKLRSSEGKGGF